MAEQNPVKREIPPALTNELIHAPWDAEQIELLQGYQKCGRVHPYTCGNGGHSHGVLTPTPDGWICEHEGCDYKQDWVASAVMRIAIAIKANPESPW